MWLSETLKVTITPMGHPCLDLMIKISRSSNPTVGSERPDQSSTKILHCLPELRTNATRRVQWSSFRRVSSFMTSREILSKIPWFQNKRLSTLPWRSKLKVNGKLLSCPAKWNLNTTKGMWGLARSFSTISTKWIPRHRLPPRLRAPLWGSRLDKKTKVSILTKSKILYKIN